MGVCGIRNSPLVRTALLPSFQNGVKSLFAGFQSRIKCFGYVSSLFVRPRKVSASGLPHRRIRQLAGPPVYEPACYPASWSVLPAIRDLGVLNSVSAAASACHQHNSDVLLSVHSVIEKLSGAS